MCDGRSTSLLRAGLAALCPPCLAALAAVQGNGPPQQYELVLLNDDKTSQNFVENSLVRVLQLEREAAHALMLRVHQEGRATFGPFDLRTAQAHVRAISLAARAKGYPLVVTYRVLRAAGALD